MTRTLGLDPGSSSAAWAIVDPDADYAVCGDVPTVDRQVDPANFARILRDQRPAMAVIEAVNAYPKQGVASVWKFGVGTGILIGATVGVLLIPLHRVHPTRWKKHFRLGADKEDARRLAIERFPRLAGDLTRKKDAGRAEALLLALFHTETQGRSR